MNSAKLFFMFEFKVSAKFETKVKKGVCVCSCSEADVFCGFPAKRCQLLDMIFPAAPDAAMLFTTTPHQKLKLKIFLCKMYVCECE